MQSFSTSADVERFLLLHGEHIVDVLGSEVDRIESKIKVISKATLPALFYSSLTTETCSRSKTFRLGDSLTFS